MRRLLVSVAVSALTLAIVVAPSGASAQSGTGAITGTVTADGEAVGDVCVDVYDASFLFEPVTDRTDGQGRYVVNGLESGEYYVAFNDCHRPAEGYAAEWYPGVSSASDADAVDVVAGQTTSGIDARLEPAGVVSGRVTDPSGRALAGACVFAVDADSGAFGETTAAEDGTYRLANLRAGTYVVFFGDCAAPYTHLTEVYDDIGPTEDGAPRSVTVAAGDVVTGIDAVLAQGGSLRGTVTAVHTGREVPFVCVGLWRVGATASEGPFDIGSSASHLLTGYAIPLPLDGAVGEYVFGGVPPGDYLLEFNAAACGDDGYEIAWWRDADTFSDADRIGVAAGQAVGDLNVVLEPRPSMSVACPEEFVTEDGFADVPSSNVHEYAIDCAVSYAITSGRADGTYGPEAPVRRDQMATFIANTLAAFGVPLPSDPPDAFRDDDGNIHERNIDTLAALGVVGGKGNGRYAPSETVSRGQMATFLVNAYRNATGYALRSSGDHFRDDERSTHEGNIDLAATAGIVAGTSSTTYRPASVVRRDQMASFLTRLLDRTTRDTLGELVAAGGTHGAPFRAASRPWHPPAG